MALGGVASFGGVESFRGVTCLWGVECNTGLAGAESGFSEETSVGACTGCSGTLLCWEVLGMVGAVTTETGDRDALFGGTMLV